MPRFVVTLTVEEMHFVRTAAERERRSISNWIAAAVAEAIRKNSSSPHTEALSIVAQRVEEAKNDIISLHPVDDADVPAWLRGRNTPAT